MTQVIKTINGRKYFYIVEWDPQRKKQIWTYQGKIEEKINPDELKKELYSSIFKSISVQKKDRRKVITSIDKVLEKYHDYW